MFGNAAGLFGKLLAELFALVHEQTDQVVLVDSQELILASQLKVGYFCDPPPTY